MAAAALSLFEQRFAQDFDECVRTGNTEWLEGWFEASMEVVVAKTRGAAVGRREREIGVYAEALARDLLELIGTWRKHVACCAQNQALRTGLGDES
jgi:hypothetical protein